SPPSAPPRAGRDTASPSPPGCRARCAPSAGHVSAGSPKLTCSMGCAQLGWVIATRRLADILAADGQLSREALRTRDKSEWPLPTANWSFGHDCCTGREAPE